MFRYSISLLLALLCGPLTAAELQDRGPASFTGTIEESEDLSAAAALGHLLVIASDEGGAIQLLEQHAQDPSWRVKGEPIRPLGGSDEIDFEGLAVQGNRVFATGSYSLKRKLLKRDNTQAENRRRLATVEAESTRDHLFRLTLDRATGKLAAPAESIDLHPTLSGDAILGPFTRIPGKENGIDVEGIAVDGEQLLLGFRSPVLREGQVPVLILTFEHPERYELRFVNAGGRGIRDLCRVEKGFLVLVGPERAGGGDFEVFLWDGRDRVPGRGAPSSGWVSLGSLPASPGASPEGLALLNETPEGYDVLVVHDGVKNGTPRLFRLSR